MSLFHPLTLAIALKFGFRSKAHRFASFVAIISIIGIALGVAALIVDTAIMQGLHNRLKQNVLSDTPHIVAEAPSDLRDKILSLDNVMALAPFVREQVLMQSKKSVALIYLQGDNLEDLKIKKGFSLNSLNLNPAPKKGSYELNAEAFVYLNNDLNLGTPVKLISTTNARYTPMGLTPSSRLFTLKTYHGSANASSVPVAVGNFEDVRKLFRMAHDVPSVRLWLTDAFKADEVEKELDAMGLKYTDWRSSQGEFFKAIAMEKLSMTIMLCLIIVVAAFNILSALTMMVSARLTEISILKSLGMSNKGILKIFLTVGVFSGMAGTLLGILIGIPLAYYTGVFMANTGAMSQVNSEISIENILYISLTSVAMSFVFTLYPAFRASRTNPVDNLSHS